MERIRARLETSEGDRGMSLVEVVVSISILGILATTALGFYLSSMNASKGHANREIAITVAGEAMEIANSYVTGDLHKGRAESVVAPQWAAASTGPVAIPGIATTYPLWDSAATASSEQALPLTSTTTLNGTVYTAQTFVGRCFQTTNAVSLASGADCAKLPGIVSAPPVTTPSGYTSLVRIIISVSWTAGDSCATPGVCVYNTSTLAALNADVEWVASD
jgi:prepilin-type N-terminal cleavage/methylation domain-containing protein